MTEAFYEFGPYRLLPESQRLLRGGGPVDLSGRQFEMLRAIVRCQGRPVSRETLLEEVWADAYVDPNNVDQQIGKLRRLLGRDEAGDWYIRLRARQGYYVAGVVYRQEMLPAPAAEPMLPGAHGHPSRRRTLIKTFAAVLLGLAVLSAIALWPRQAHIVRVRQLTRNNRQKYGPLVSDGRVVYFTQSIGGVERVASVPIGGGDATEVLPTGFEGSLQAITPDGRSLLVASRARLFEFRLAERDLREVRMPPGAYAGYGALKPDGSRIAEFGPNGGDIFDWNNPGNNIHLPLLGAEAHWHPSRPIVRFSIFDMQRAATVWWEYDVARKERRQLPSLTANPHESAGGWSRDGEFYVFQTGSEGESQLWLADGAVRHSYRLTDDALIWKHPVFSSAWNEILALGSQSQGDLVNLAGGKSPLPGVPAYEVDYSRDGAWIAYTRFPEHSIWRCRVDGSDRLRLSPPGMIGHQPRWSPDGTRIAFMALAAGESRSRIAIVPSPGGPLDVPLPEGDDQGVPTWSADGASIAFGDHNKPTKGAEQSAIHVLDLRTRRVSDLRGPVPLWSPRLSPDGRWLAAISRDSKALYVRRLPDGEWQRRLTMIFVAEPIWSYNSQWIQVMGMPEPARYLLYRVRPTAGREEVAADVTDVPRIGSEWFGLTPDGSPLALRRGGEEIYALEWRLEMRGIGR